MRTSRAPGRVTLPRAISKLGFASRSQALRLIEAGEVLVNGAADRNPHRWIDLRHDRIEIRNTALTTQAFRYVLFHKPAGCVTTRSDEKGRPTVLDELGAAGKGVNPVGRLDLETTGLLLLTNDHQLADRLTSPTSGVPKRYVARLDRPVSDDHLRRLSDGLNIRMRGHEVLTKPALALRRENREIEITITEGKNRQVRRMLKSIGYEVKSLHRIAVGPLQLGALNVGESRELSAEEVGVLRQAVGLSQSAALETRSTRRPLKRGLLASYRKPGR